MTFRPNLILLTIDSLSADHAIADRMPVLHRFARRCVSFSQAFSQGPFTAFSMPSLFTGRYPCRLAPMARGLSSANLEHQAGRVVRGTPTLAACLRDSGYHTAGFHSNPLLSRLFGFDQGFDYFYDDVFHVKSSWSQNIQLNISRAQRIWRTDPYLSARNLHKRVLAWLTTAPEPFFLWIHYMDAHGPYLARKVLRNVSRDERLWRRSLHHPERINASERERLHGNYCRQIQALDLEMNVLFQALDSRLERSVVAITADHGEEFGEHGGYTHHQKLFDELTHVPLWLAAPGLTPRT